MAASRSDREPRKGSGSRRAEASLAEQEVERPSRAAARPAASRGGMGIGGKVGLITALVTAAVLAAAVLPGRGDDGGQAARDEATLQEAGLSAVSVLAAIDSSFWLGGAAGDTKPLARLKKNVEELFGERIARYVEEAEAELKSVPKDEDAEEREERGRRLKKFEEALERLERGGGGGGAETAARAKGVLGKIPRDAAPGSAFQTVAAWVREGRPDKPGAFIAGTHAEAALTYDAARRDGSATIFWAPGQLSSGGNTYAMRVFGARAQGKADATVFVGVVGNPAPAQGGGGLGLVLLLVGPLVVGLAGFAVANGIGAQVRGLARELEKVGSSGDPHRAIRAQGAEASQVARAVERMLSTIEFRQQQGGGEMADMDAIVERERKLAGEIHEGLINKHPPRLSDYEVEHLFKPGFEVGGDHFEYFRIDDDHLGVILLDTNVRGIPAAIVMSAARAYVRAAAPGSLSPADVLRRVNTLLAGELPPGRHVTALYAVVDTAQGKVTLASAGHLPVLVYRQATGKIAKANPAGIALGLDVGPVFDRELEEGDIALGPGDRLVLYTDGALKITNEAGEEFGESRFYSAVAREAPKNSQAFVNFVGSAIDSFHLTTPQNDDVTISTIKRLR